MRRLCCSLLVTVALIACGRQNADVAQNAPPRPGGSRQPESPANNRPMMNPVMPPDMGRGQSAVAQLKVELNEYEIRMPATLIPGRYTLTVVNSGKQNHSLVVEGSSLHAALSQQLTRGDSAQLDVDLKPGTYTVYCPVDEHRGKGMSKTVTVQ